MALDFITSRSSSDYYIELDSFNLISNRDELSKSELYEIHQNQLQNGITNENHTVLIVNILGDIQPFEHNPEHSTKYKSLKEQRILYSVKKNETFLHYAFTNTIAENIIKVIYNKYLILILIILYLLWWIWIAIRNEGINYRFSTQYFQYKAILLPIICLWQLLMILSVNIFNIL